MKFSPALTAIFLFFAFSSSAAEKDTLSDAEMKGRELAQQYLQQKPTANAEQTGVLKIRDAKRKTIEFLVKCRIIVTATNYQLLYEAFQTNSDLPFARLRVIRNDTSNTILYTELDHELRDDTEEKGVNGHAIPFAHSDFSSTDLGSEFFHWPQQKILKHEMRRSRACRVLESTNPNPSTNGYSRVLAWIDNDSGGIVHAGAYDFKNKLLKEFDPRSFKKVNGQWALQEMEIRNVQTDSRTRLEFDLKKD
jgi:hypothetical protein